MKIYRYIFLLPLIALVACADEDIPKADTQQQDIYLAVDLNGSDTRLAYEYAQGSGVNGSGNIRTSWQIGDMIKVYETDAYGTGGAFTDVYHDHNAYNAAFTYPGAPTTDKYYRFVCVGGEGTPHGLFKYVGLATATVSESNGIRNVEVDIKYDHKINNWNKFQGLAIYGSPLRNTLMRTQVARDDMSHIRYGERMYGYICAHNFQWWYDNDDHTAGAAGADRVVMRNTGGCIFRVIIGGVDIDIYGGSNLTLEMPGVTDQGDDDDPRHTPMTLTLGDPNDHALGFEPWYHGGGDDAFCAYVVGWPGTLAANPPATITLKESLSQYVYQWELTSPDPITFEEGVYYTIDLRDHEYTKTIPTNTP